jgi:septal ring factor EnvC (AmiA/AmiB activator)
VLWSFALFGAGSAGSCVVFGDASAQAKTTPKTNAKSGDTTSDVTPQRRQQLQSEQKQLQQRLQQLRKQLVDAEASHSEASDALASSERAISAANRHLRELAEIRRQVERQVLELQEHGRGVGARQSDQEQQLVRLVKAQQRLGQGTSWQRWLAGDSPAAVARDMHYLDLATQARVSSIVELRDRREELHQLETESVSKQAELARIADDEKHARAQLLQQQNARKQTLARLSQQISGQRQTIASLERDDQRLTGLVEQLTRLLAEQARRAEQSRRAAAAPSASGKQTTPGLTGEVEPPPGSKAAALREKMRLPVQGQVIARFGTVRKTEAGVNAPTWKGVLIRAPQGTDVRAAAAGRVVFADWLRGFGNLLILDHGEGVLTVYGNNESLLRSVGERVEADEVIAAVGNTGGNTESGLYFEVRFEGRPIDPLKWAQAR